MVRKLVTAVTLALCAVAGAHAQTAPPSLLMPGVTYERQVEFTPHGPVVVDVVIGPKPDGTLYTLAPVLSNGAIVGTERLTDMEKNASVSSTLVGVNGDFFTPDPGKPAGMLMRGGVLDSAPAANRSSLGIASDGTLSVASVGFDGTWRGNGQRRQLDLNAPPVKSHTTLYTSTWGPTTPAEAGVAVVVLSSLPPLVPNRVASGVVAQVATAGPVAIPPGGAVLVSRGNQAPHLTAEAPAGTTVEIRPTLTPNWSSMQSAIGGGPLLVANGKPVFRAREAFGDPVLNRRSARTAVGQLPDGRILFAAVEGGGPAYSAGMTNYELAVAVSRLGVKTAMGLANGPVASLAFDGALLTRPTGPTEQPISDALVLSYNGVYAAPPSSETLSPNGDGTDDVETFSYKLVRPSSVTAVVQGPAQATQTLLQEPQQPGIHTVQWDGKNVEGEWRFVVSAVDDTGRTTTADRQFSLNQTLGSLQVERRGNGLAASFALARAANVTVTVEKPNGIVVATLVSKKLDAGPQTAAWTGSAPAGYKVRVVAANAVGTATLLTALTSRS